MAFPFLAAAVPALAGLSAPAALGIGAALTGGAALLNSQGQAAHADRQQKANEAWLAYQNNKSNAFERRDTKAREAAQSALNANLEEAGGDARREVIANESDRLSEAFTRNLPETADAIRGSGQEAGTSKVFDKAMARSVGNATSEARKRMQALATATAYGGGSRGGMGMTDRLRNANTGNALRQIGDERYGQQGILQRYQGIAPEMLEYQQSPLVPFMNAGGSFMLGGGPQNLGTLFPSLSGG